MPHKTKSVETFGDRTSRVARDLRAYADAGMDPAFAIKLLAIAAELEALVGLHKTQAA